MSLSNDDACMLVGNHIPPNCDGLPVPTNVQATSQAAGHTFTQIQGAPDIQRRQWPVAYFVHLPEHGSHKIRGLGNLFIHLQNNKFTRVVPNERRQSPPNISPWLFIGPKPQPRLRVRPHILPAVKSLEVTTMGRDAQIELPDTDTDLVAYGQQLRSVVVFRKRPL